MITPQRVHEIFDDCLFNEGEDTQHHVIAEGLTLTVGFHPERLRSNKAAIAEMLNELPEGFKDPEGMSFLYVGRDKEEKQWTGLQRNMQELILLGIGVQIVTCVFPRELWKSLPGAVPYYSINTETTTPSDSNDKVTIPQN